VIPKEGVTGWLDTWMPSAKAKHPNGAYLWMNYITSPKAQAQQATKVNIKIAQTSDEMVALMRSGGGEQYDMTSATRPHRP
jgi:spermidine/putrescine-binding protein